MKAAADSFLWELFKHAFAVGAGLSTAGAAVYVGVKVARHGLQSLSIQKAIEDLRDLKQTVTDKVQRSGVVEIVDDKKV